MKKFDVSIRAFVKGNLGDDVFIHILCERYPNASFAICGEREYRHLLEEHKNLTYVCTDDFFRRNLFRVRNLPAHVLNRIRKLFHKSTKWKYYRCPEYLNDRSRYLVLISGSIFMQMNPSFEKNAYYAAEQKYYKKKPIVIGCNFGPYLQEEYREFYADCFSKAGYVCFRDSYSYSLFEGENLEWAPDILFLYPRTKCVMPQQNGYIFISVVNLLKDKSEDTALEDKYENALAGFIRSQQEKGERIVLAGFCKNQGDHEVIERILDKLPEAKKITVINYPEISYQELVGYIAAAKSVVATRYHAMILGWLYGKKVLPICYSEKMVHVIEDAFPDAPYVSISTLTEQKLQEAYEWNQAPAAEQIEELIRKAGKQFEVLDKLLK